MKNLALGKMPADATPEQYLAAGPWCFQDQEAIFPDFEKRFTFAPEPLARPGALAPACRAAQSLCMKLIDMTAELLTRDAALLPKTYWQILLAPWLMDLASQIVDRSLRCQAMLELWREEQLGVAVLPANCEFNFEDEQDFTLRGSLGLDFNHWLFSLILQKNWPEKWQKIELAAIAAKKRRGKSLLTRIARCSFVQESAFPRFRGMSLLESARFSRALNHKCKTPDHSLNLDTAFSYPEDLARIMLPDLAPLLKVCLPASIRNLAHKPIAPDKNAPKLKIAATASHEDAALRQRLAIWRCQGNRIGHIQHGGNYGQVETPCQAEVVEYSQDVFFTWGWRAQGQAKGNFVPMPAPQLASLADSWHRGRELIFIGTEMPLYGRRLDSHPTPLQYLEYRQAKADFFTALGAELQPHSLYRPYFSLPGTLEDAAWLMPKFPRLRLCEGPLLPEMQGCRLLVIDHHGTSLLEAMAANIPVILYWKREYWPLSPECDILLDLLAAAGIWHATPEKAAEKAREVWDDPEAWQNSPQIQLCRKVFCQNQARTSPETASIWLKTLGEL